MESVCVWLADRLDLQLHTYQLKTLIKIVKVKMEDWQDKRSAHSLVHTGRLKARGFFFSLAFLFSAKRVLTPPLKKKVN